MTVDDSKHLCVSNNNKRLHDRSNSKILWHYRLGHIRDDKITKLEKDGLLGPLGSEPYPTCESCILGKMTKWSYIGQGIRVTELLGLIHSDVCGPINVIARGGYQYFITFTDDMSRYGYVYLMRHKSQSFEMFKDFKAEVKNQTGKKIKALRSDRGGEYLTNEFEDFLRVLGIISQRAPPGTPQLNGVSNRRNRALIRYGPKYVKFVSVGTRPSYCNIYPKHNSFQVSSYNTI